jgi:branched-chain amino acid transport system ATP-binding protein
MLKISGIDTFYGDLQALWGISLEVNEGELVSLIGPNGAGKTTTLRSITGLQKPTQGSIHFMGKNLAKEPPDRIVDLGISQVLEGARIFAGMSVLENLELGAFVPRARKDKEQTLESVFGTFPRLKERIHQRAGTLSGGERQMLGIGRALMAHPKLLLLDEPSFGLAPIMVDNIFEMVQKINQQGVTILLVEQNVRAALELAQRAYVIENGRIVGQGTGDDLLSFESVRSAYLGK